MTEPKIVSVAQLVDDYIPIVRQDDERGTIAVRVPDGWDDVKKICKKALRVDDKFYGFTGWNSDTNEAYFATMPVAQIVRKPR